MDIRTIKDKGELLKYKSDILKLFSQVFDEELSEDLWRWAYIDNPFGDPSVSLCLDEGVVGHYAAIPYPLEDNARNEYSAFLSMTTMVASSHRKYGLFTKLATATYQELRDRGADWVMGFPNEMSAPGFRKRLDWTVLDADYVVSVNRKQLLEVAESIKSHMDEMPRTLTANLSEESVRTWRLSKPGADYKWTNGVAYKTFGDQVDVMYYEDVECLRELPESPLYNILVPRDVVKNMEVVSFEYQFGGIGLNKDFSPEHVRRQMCMSDVF
ncbi:GNAT family N-acetyltransferase [Marinobacter sp. AN1]|uniref:GNAT family N-acetyltransferase n=1 Tax=Marinobacter sp. AN1 TaxID=2886046 RepID=UPI00222F1739|nr:GNAT family N-acetyltransferase [Marinobacter sp. AN1]UZD64739.1 GNAT family N-acetyltransferase [Marinobacter sp. AN1]